jgi:hypothetical protein
MGKRPMGAFLFFRRYGFQFEGVDAVWTLKAVRAILVLL